MTVDQNRRPIGQRNRFYATYLTRVLSNAGVSPNLISFTSVIFAALAGACLFASGIAQGGGDRTMLLLGGALFCQLRLLANMLDGMVAVEAGKGSPDGLIWNELPDRFADIFILVGAGYGVAATGMFDATLGWAAAVFAVMTAYVREVGKAAGAPADFSGPMAKPHRMFWLTIAALISIFDPYIGPAAARILDWGYVNDSGKGVFIAFALWLILMGAIATTFGRAARALAFLRKV
ncbi:MAG: CDP-alcohol phosphatidyltransferase family protein [Hyphomonadaceae bacterium]|nr:CDP-alcohol phosphatidyltransferase family protein [Hyphomonadaceae bacterium]